MTRVFVQFVCCIVSFATVTFVLLGLTPVHAASNVVLYASEAPVRSGWNVVSDSGNISDLG